MIVFSRLWLLIKKYEGISSIIMSLETVDVMIILSYSALQSAHHLHENTLWTSQSTFGRNIVNTLQLGHISDTDK